MSYPNTNYPMQDEIACARMATIIQRNYRRAAEIERDAALAEAEKWRNAHHSVVVTKRRLSAKYGEIMRKKPRARLTRLRKWIGGRR